MSKYIPYCLENEDTEVILVGSRGRIKYKNELMKLFKEINSKSILKTVTFNLNKKDYDYLCVTNNYKQLLKNIDIIIDKTNASIITIKKDLITIVIENIKYDFFICKKKDKYYYFLFLILGKIYNIILRLKVKKLGLKLNRYGLYDNDKKIYFRFNKSKNIFYNITIILKYIESI